MPDRADAERDGEHGYGYARHEQGGRPGRAAVYQDRAHVVRSGELVDRRVPQGDVERLEQPAGLADAAEQQGERGYEQGSGGPGRDARAGSASPSTTCCPPTWFWRTGAL